MKKFITVDLVVLIITIACLLMLAFGVGDAQAAFGLPTLIDTTWSFDRAIISLPYTGFASNSFCVEGKVDSWKDFENSDMIQVEIGGVVYLTHSSNVVLISE